MVFKSIKSLRIIDKRKNTIRRKRLLRQEKYSIKNYDDGKNKKLNGF